MKTNIFSRSNFSVMKFCRNKSRRRVIACISAVLMMAGSVMGGTVVLNSVGGNGGAVWNSAVGATVSGDGTVATASLLAGRNAGLIDWQALSIGSGQTLNFNGQMFYNVVSGGNASQIAGTLNANGSVWVFNPAGVSFMNGAQVNVAGLFGVAAANLANKDTLESEINAGTPLADMSIPQLGDMMGDVSVANGAAFSGASVALLGKSVSVQGGSEFNVGQTTLAAGEKMVVDNVEGGKVSIKLSDFADDVDDVDVTFSESDSDGKTVNVAGDLDVATEGKVLFNEGVVASGSVKVDGLKKAGSEVVVSPKQLSVASGKLLQGKSVNATAAGKVAVDGSISAADGDVALASADEVLVNGTVSASGVTGGNVAISGNNVGNFGTISANGTVGGAGTVRIDAANAVALGKDSVITANAGANGNGGTVEVIAQNYANLMEGSRIEAKGGAQSGNGGFVETSGYQSMDVKGTVDTTAANGAAGTWLIDPYNVEIVAGTGNTNVDTTSDPYTPTDTGAQIGAGDIVTALGTSDVKITTTPSPDAGAEDGNLTVGAAIDYSTLSGKTLTLDAAKDIKINAAINGGTENNFTANAGKAIDVKANVSGGNVKLDAGKGVTVAAGATVKASAADPDASTKAVTIAASGDNATILGTVTAEADAGSVVITAMGEGVNVAKSVVVAGEVSGKAGVTLEGNKSVQIGNGGAVSSSGGDVMVTAKEFVAVDNGSVTADNGTATLKTTEKELLTAGGSAANYQAGQLAGVMVGGSSTGSVSAKKVVVESKGSVLVNTGSSVTGTDSVEITANGKTEATVPTSGITKQGVYINGGMVMADKGDIGVTSKGVIVIDGTVTATKDPNVAGTGAVTLTAGDTGASAVVINGAVTGDGDVTVEAGGNIKVQKDVISNDGDVSMMVTDDTSKMSIKIQGGKIEGKNVELGDEYAKSVQVLNGTVTATGGDVTIKADEYVVVNKNVTANGDVEIATTGQETLTEDLPGGAYHKGEAAGVNVLGGTIEGENVSINSKGSIQTTVGTTIKATGGDVTLTANGTQTDTVAQGVKLGGAVTAKDEAKAQALKGGVEVTATGSIAGDVTTTLYGKTGVVGAGAVGKAGSALATTSADGTVNLTGKVLGSTAEFTAKDAVSVANAENDFTGVVKASGASVTLKDANDLTLGATTATKGNVDVTAGDKLTVAGTVTATKGADGTGNVTLTAGTDKTISVNGSVTADATAKFNNDADVNAGGSVAATTVDATGKGLTVKAKDGATPAGVVTADGIVASTLATAGTVKADTIDAAVTQTDGTINRSGADKTLTFKNTIDQQGGTIGDSTTPYAVTMEESLTQSGGSLNASTLTLMRGAGQTTADGSVNAAKIILPGAAFDVSFDKGNNAIGNVRGFVKNLALRDTDGGVVIGDSSEVSSNNKVSAAGTVTIAATDGNILQEGNLVAAGVTDLTAKNVTLTHEWNSFNGGVKVNATADNGSVRLVHRKNVDSIPNLDVQGVTAGVDGKRGDIRIEAVAGGVSVSGAVSGKNVTLKAANGVTEGAAVNATADKYVKAVDGDINVNANSTVGGNVAYVAEGSTARVKTGDGVKIASTADGGLVYVKDSAGATATQGGNATSKDGVTTFTDASVVAIDTADKVVVNNKDKAVTVGTLDASGATVTEVLSDPAGGTATVSLGAGGGTAASGIKAKDVAINVTGNPGTTAVTVDKAITATGGNVAINAEKGDVNVNATVTATATAKIDAAGKVRVKGDVTGASVDLDAGDFINVASGKTVKATTGNVTMDSTSGNVDVSGMVKAENGSVGITASGNGKSIKVQGANAVVSGATSVTMTGGKSVQVIGGAKVESDGTVGATAAEYIAVNGTVDGKAGVTLETTAEDKLTSAVGGFPAGAPAGVIVSGGAVKSADGTVAVTSKGSVMVDGTSEVAGKSVEITADGTGDGQGVQIAGTVTATGGTLGITAQGNEGIQATGTLVADNGAATLTADNGSIAAENADNDFKGVTATAKDVALKDKDDITLTSVTVTAGNVGVTAGGKLTVTGAVTATKGADGTGNVTLKTTAGEIDVSAVVTADATAKVDAAGNVRVKGDVTGAAVDLDAGNFINVAAGKKVEATTGEATLDAVGNVDVYGTVKSDVANVVITTTGAGKSIKVNGEGASVSGKGSVALEGGKSVQVIGGAKVESDGTVGATAAEYIAVNGTVDGKAGVTLKTTAADKLTAAVGGYPAGAPAGVIVSGGAVKSADGTVAVTSKGSVMVDGTSEVAGKSVEITANGTGDGQGVQIAGAVTATGGTLGITVHGNGGIQATGTLVADNGATTLTAANGVIDAQNAANDFKSLTATAKDSIALNDKDDITLTEVKSVAGDVRVKAVTDNLTVSDADAVKVSGVNVRLDAAEGAILVGAGVSGKNVTLNAGSTVETKAKSAGVADGALTADKGDLYIVAGGNVKLGGTQTATADTDLSAADKGGVMAIVSDGKIEATGKTKAGTLYTKDTDGVSFIDVSVEKMSATSGKDIKFTFDTDVEVAYKSTGGKVEVESSGNVTVKSATAPDADLMVTEVKWPSGTEEVTLVNHTDADTQVNGITAATTASVKSTGDGKDVIVETQVVGGEGVTLTSDKGNVKIGTDTASGALVKAGKFDTPTGPTRPVIADGDNANLVITAGNGVKVQNEAMVGASGTATVTANGDDGIAINASKVASHKGMTLSATKDGAGSLTVRNGYVGTDGALAINAKKDVVIDPSVVEAADDIKIDAGSDVVIEASRVSSSKTIKIGDASAIGGNVTIKADASDVSSTVMAEQGLKVKADGNIKVSKSVVESGLVYAGVDSEDVHVSDAKAGMTLNAGKGVSLEDGARVGAADKMDVEAKTDGVTVTGGSILASNGAMTIDADGGAVKVEGNSKVVSASTLAVGTADGKMTASLTVNGSDLVAKGDLTAKASGAILADSSAKVASDATTRLEGASVTAQGGAKVLAGANVDIDAAGAVTVDGATVAANGADTATTKAVDIQAGTSVTVQGGTVEAKNAGGSVAVKAGTGVAIEKGTQDAMVKAGNDVTIDTTSGNVTVGKADIAADASSITATAGKVAITAKEADGQSVTVRDAATVTAGAAVEVTAKGVVSVNDTASVRVTGGSTASDPAIIINGVNGVTSSSETTIDAKDANLKVVSQSGAISLAGTISAKDADFTAGQDITADNVNNDFTGTVTADGASFMLRDANDVNLGDVNVNGVGNETDDKAGSAVVETVAGTITVLDGATVKSENANVKLTASTDANAAEGDINVVGVVDAQKTATLTASKGKIADKDVSISHGDAETSPWATEADAYSTHVKAKDAVLSAQSIGEANKPLDIAAETVDATATAGSVYLWEKDGIEVKNISATGGNAEIENLNGNITLSGPALATVDNGVGGNVLIGAKSGTLTLGKIDGENVIGGTVDAGNAASLLAGTKIEQNATVKAEASVDAQAFGTTGTIDLRKDVTTEAANIRYVGQGGVTIGEGATIGKDSANVAVNGPLSGKGKVVADTFAFDGASLGTSSSPMNLSVNTLAAETTGDVFVENDKALTIGAATAVNGGIARVHLDGEVSTIGAVASGNEVKGVTSTGGNISLTANGKMTVNEAVSAATDGKNAVLETTSGDIELNAAVTAGKDATVTAANGAVAVAGSVSGDATTALSGATGISGAGAVGKAGSALTVANTTSGGISLTGTVKGTTADFTAAGQSVSVAGDANDFTGTVTANGSEVTLKDANGIALGEVTATAGGVAVTAGSIEANGEVKAQGTEDSANILLNATGADGVTLNGDVTAAKNVSVIADAGNIEQKANITAQYGTVDVDAAGTLNMAAGKTTEATGNILYVGNGGTVNGKLDATGTGSQVKIVGSGIGGGAELSADEIVLNVTQLGEAGSPVTLNASKLAIEAPGGIYVNNGKTTEIVKVDEAAVAGFKVNRVKADLTTEEHGLASGTGVAHGLSAVNGDIELSNAGSVTADADVTAKNVTITTTGNGDITVNAEKTVAATEGNVVLTADKSAEVSGTVTAQSDATITANGTDATDGAKILGTVTATAGDASVDAANDISVSGTVEAGNNATINAAKAVLADGDVLAKNGKADIDAGTTAKVSDDGTVTATAGAVEITAANAIEMTDTAAVEAGTSVTVKSTAAGDVTIDTTGSVTANDGDVVINNDNGAVTVQNATVNATKNVTIDTTGGDVAIKDATVTAGDNIHIATTDTTAGGDVKIDTGVNMSAGNNLTIEANKGVEINTVTAEVKAENGDAVVIAHDGAVNMGNDTALTAGKNVVIEATAGVALSRVNASTTDGTVFVRTTDGNITDVNDDASANVTAKNAAFSAANGSVGAVGNHVDTSVEAVAATTRDGVFMTEGDGVAVDAVPEISANKVKADGTVEPLDTSAVSGLTSTDNGPVILEATEGNIDVNQAIVANGANGNVLVAANADGGNITLGADVTAAQSATIVAGGKIDQNADVTATAGDAYVEALGGNVTMADGTTTEATVGNARVAASGNVALSAVNAADSASVKATVGLITDNTAAEDANVTAQKLRLEAGAAVGGAAAADIDISVDNVEVKAGTDAFVQNDRALTVGGVDGVTTKKVSSVDASTSDVADADLTGASAVAGDIRIEANGEMTVAEDVTTTARPTGADGDKAGNIRLEAANGNLSVDAAVSGNNVTLASSGDTAVADGKKVDVAKDLYIKAGGNIDLNATGADKAAVGETMALVSGGAINASGLKASVLYTSDNNGVTIKDAEVSKQAKGTSDGNIDVEFTGDATVAYKAGGYVKVSATGVLTVDSADGTDGSIAVTEALKGDDVTDANGGVEEIPLVGKDGEADSLEGVTSDNSYVSLKGASVTVNQAVAANGGNAVLESTTDGVELNADVTAAQDATVLAKAGVSQNANVTATAGDAYVEAQGGAVTMKDGTATTAGNNARVAASGNVALSAVNAANSASVKATAGSITDNTSGEAANVTAQKLRLEAGAAVGGTGAANVDTSVDNVEVKAGTDVYVHNDKAVTVGGVDGVTTRKVSTADATTSDVADADLTGAEATSGNLSLLANGKMTVNEAATAGANAALETAADGVELNADVTAAQDATVLAKAGVSQNANVTTTAGDAYVEAQGGDVTMKDGTATTAGNNARVAASGNVALSTVNAANSASVKATAGSITDNTSGEAANVTAQKLRLEAGAAVGGTGAANVDTSVDNVEVKAGTDVYVHNDKAVTVGGVDGVTTRKVSTADATTSDVADADLTGAEATSGNLSLLANGKMTVNEASTAGANAALETAADGVELNADVTAAQDATVLAKAGVSQNANVTATAGDAYVEAQGGDVTMKDGTTTTAGNNARVAASGNVALSAVNAVNSASVKATAGSITDNTAAEDANVTVQKLRLEAGAAVGGTGVANVDTSVDNIEVKAGTDVYVHNNKAVTVGGVNGVATRKVSTADASTVNVVDGNLTGAVATSGDLSIRADGNMAVVEDVSAATDGKNVTLEATSGGVQIGSVVTAGNDAKVRAVSGIGITGTVDAKATATLEGTGPATVTTLAGSSVVRGSTVTFRNTTVSQAQGGKVQATMLDLQNAGKDTVLASTKNEVANVKGNAKVLVLEDAVDLRVAPEGLTTTGNTRIETVGGKDITVDGKVNVTGNATMMSAGNLTLNGDVTVGGASANTLDIEASAGTVVMGSGVTAKTTGGNIAVVAKKGDIEIANLDVGSGNVWLEAGGSIKTKNGEGETGISAGGAGMSADKIGDAGEGNAMRLNFDKLSLSGTQGVYVENGKDAIVVAVSQNGTTGAFNVNRVETDGSAKAKTPGTASQSRGASSDIGGVVSEKGDVELKNKGHILIEDGAQIKAKENVVVTADGNIRQSTTSIPSDKKGVVGNVGTAEAGISGTTVKLDAGGTIGSGSQRAPTPLRVEGAVTATASGTAAVASSGGDLSATSISGTDVNVYAPRSINTGKITASRTLTVTAGDYENGEVIIDTKNLVVNRINGGHKPQLALFKTQGNKKPNVKNQPNDTIIFIDGRVAGGDIQTINKLGALEAFPVQTPELKSEQGVFGNPFFMHGDMDVSEPVALGIIDFLLVDPSAIRYGAEFPLDADTQVEATGLSPEYSYRFLGKKKEIQQNPDASSGNEKSESEKGKSE